MVFERGVSGTTTTTKPPTKTTTPSPPKPTSSGSSSGSTSTSSTTAQHLPGTVIPGQGGTIGVTPVQTKGSAPQLPSTTGQTGTGTPGQLVGGQSGYTQNSPVTSPGYGGTYVPPKKETKGGDTYLPVIKAPPSGSSQAKGDKNLPSSFDTLPENVGGGKPAPQWYKDIKAEQSYVDTSVTTPPDTLSYPTFDSRGFINRVKFKAGEPVDVTAQTIQRLERTKRALPTKVDDKVFDYLERNLALRVKLTDSDSANVVKIQEALLAGNLPTDEQFNKESADMLATFGYTPDSYSDKSYHDQAVTLLNSYGYTQDTLLQQSVNISLNDGTKVYEGRDWNKLVDSYANTLKKTNEKVTFADGTVLYEGNDYQGLVNAYAKILKTDRTNAINQASINTYKLIKYGEANVPSAISSLGDKASNEFKTLLLDSVRGKIHGDKEFQYRASLIIDSNLAKLNDNEKISWSMKNGNFEDPLTKESVTYKELISRLEDRGFRNNRLEVNKDKSSKEYGKVTLVNDPPTEEFVGKKRYEELVTQYMQAGQTEWGANIKGRNRKEAEDLVNLRLGTVALMSSPLGIGSVIGGAMDASAKATLDSYVKGLNTGKWKTPEEYASVVANQVYRDPASAKKYSEGLLKNIKTYLKTPPAGAVNELYRLAARDIGYQDALNKGTFAQKVLMEGAFMEGVVTPIFTLGIGYVAGAGLRGASVIGGKLITEGRGLTKLAPSASKVFVGKGVQGLSKTAGITMLGVAGAQTAQELYSAGTQRQFTEYRPGEYYESNQGVNLARAGVSVGLSWASAGVGAKAGMRTIENYPKWSPKVKADFRLARAKLTGFVEDVRAKSPEIAKMSDWARAMKSTIVSPKATSEYFTGRDIFYVKDASGEAIRPMREVGGKPVEVRPKTEVLEIVTPKSYDTVQRKLFDTQNKVKEILKQDKELLRRVTNKEITKDQFNKLKQPIHNSYDKLIAEEKLLTEKLSELRNRGGVRETLGPREVRTFVEETPNKTAKYLNDIRGKIEDLKRSKMRNKALFKRKDKLIELGRKSEVLTKKEYEKLQKSLDKKLDFLKGKEKELSSLRLEPEKSSRMFIEEKGGKKKGGVSPIRFEESGYSNLQNYITSRLTKYQPRVSPKRLSVLETGKMKKVGETQARKISLVKKEGKIDQYSITVPKGTKRLFSLENLRKKKTITPEAETFPLVEGIPSEPLVITDLFERPIRTESGKLVGVKRRVEVATTSPKVELMMEPREAITSQGGKLGEPTELREMPEGESPPKLETHPTSSLKQDIETVIPYGGPSELGWHEVQLTKSANVMTQGRSIQPSSIKEGVLRGVDYTFTPKTSGVYTHEEIIRGLLTQDIPPEQRIFLKKLTAMKSFYAENAKGTYELYIKPRDFFRQRVKINAGEQYSIGFLKQVVDGKPSLVVSTGKSSPMFGTRLLRSVDIGPLEGSAERFKGKTVDGVEYKPTILPAKEIPTRFGESMETLTEKFYGPEKQIYRSPEGEVTRYSKGRPTIAKKTFKSIMGRLQSEGKLGYTYEVFIGESRGPVVKELKLKEMTIGGKKLPAKTIYNVSSGEVGHVEGFISGSHRRNVGSGWGEVKETTKATKEGVPKVRTSEQIVRGQVTGPEGDFSLLKAKGKTTDITDLFQREYLEKKIKYFQDNLGLSAQQAYKMATQRAFTSMSSARTALETTPIGTATKTGRLLYVSERGTTRGLQRAMGKTYQFQRSGKLVFAPKTIAEPRLKMEVEKKVVQKYAQAGKKAETTKLQNWLSKQNVSEVSVNKFIIDEISRSLNRQQERYLTNLIIRNIAREINKNIVRSLNREINKNIPKEINREIERQINRELQRQVQRQVPRAITRVIPEAVPRFVPPPVQPPEITPRGLEFTVRSPIILSPVAKPSEKKVPTERKRLPGSGYFTYTERKFKIKEFRLKPTKEMRR